MTATGSGLSETDARLLERLGAQRHHVLGITEGLSETQLTTPVLVSGWSIAQLLHHLALDDERFWFKAVVAGRPDAIAELGPDAWQVADGRTGEDVRALYRREAAATDELLCGISWDAAPAWWPDFFGDFRLTSVRDVVVHMVVETATHAGHLDVVRELIDGRQWLVLD